MGGHRHRRDRSHHRRKTRYPTSSSSDSSSSDSSSSASSGQRKHKRRHRRTHYRRHPHRRRWSSSTSAPSVSCAPPVPSRLRRKIHRGEFVEFVKLLTPTHTPPLFQSIMKQKHKHKEAKRVMTDLATWLEAWNRFLCCHLSYFPTTALEMVKYQTLLVMLFPPQHCLEYNRLFRQTPAQDPALRWDAIKEDIYVWAITKTPAQDPALRWDAIKEDIYVWAITKKGQSFRDKPSIMSRLGPPPPHSRHLQPNCP